MAAGEEGCLGAPGACPRSPMPATSLIAFARLCPSRFAGGQHSQIVQQARRSPALKRSAGSGPARLVALDGMQ